MTKIYQVILSHKDSGKVYHVAAFKSSGDALSCHLSLTSKNMGMVASVWELDVLEEWQDCIIDFTKELTRMIK